MRNLEGNRIVTASEMARIEGLAFAEGQQADVFMQNAGEAVARYVRQFIEQNGCAHEVLLLVGKGNNGGDAYAAGIALMGTGVKVSAYHLFSLDLCGPLCQEKCEAFQKAGGAVHFFHKEQRLEMPSRGVILDGLLGTGFRGQVEGLLAQVITAANKSGLPIIAIDIPSGVNGDTGEVGTVAIEAALTVYLGMPKLGFFIRQGYDHIGKLAHADFGMPSKFSEDARADGYLVNASALPALVPREKRTQNKYSRGYVLAIAGSPGMTGAAFMSCLSALRSGTGIVRFFYPLSIHEEMVAAPWELVRQPFEFHDISAIVEEAKRAGALLFGPGMGKEPPVAKLLKKVFHDIQLPMVIDADGLHALSSLSIGRFPPGCIITPHKGELKKVLGLKEVSEEELLSQAQKYADLHDVTIIYKGAPTWVLHPGTLPLAMPVGDPGMATAGSGDVLTGIVATFLAKKLPPREAAALAVAVHGVAGQVAAIRTSSHGLIASDIIASLPKVFLLDSLL